MNSGVIVIATDALRSPGQCPRCLETLSQKSRFRGLPLQRQEEDFAGPASEVHVSSRGRSAGLWPTLSRRPRNHEVS